VQYLRIYPFLC